MKKILMKSTSLASALCLAVAFGISIESSAIAQIQIGDIRLNSKGGSISISSSTTNGVKTTNIVDNGKKAKIVESDEDGIAITLRKSYGPEDKEQLKKDHPGVFMHLTAFPTQSDDGDEIELQINIKKTYKAQNADELKEKYPKAFAAYKKYSKGLVHFGARPFGGIRLLDVPRIEIKPGDRIIEIKTDKDSDADGKEDKQEEKKEEKKKTVRFKDA